MKKQINNSKLIVYSAVAGAALAIAPNTFADVIYQNVNILFGDGQGGRKNLTMEGTHSEFWFDGDGFYSFFNWAYIGPATNIPNNFGGYFCTNTKGDWAANNDTNYCGVSFKLESDTNKTVYGLTLLALGAAGIATYRGKSN